MKEKFKRFVEEAKHYAAPAAMIVAGGAMLVYVSKDAKKKGDDAKAELLNTYIDMEAEIRALKKVNTFLSEYAITVEQKALQS